MPTCRQPEIAELLRANPSSSYRDLARQTGCSLRTIHKAVHNYGFTFDALTQQYVLPDGTDSTESPRPRTVYKHGRLTMTEEQYAKYRELALETLRLGRPTAEFAIRRILGDAGLRVFREVCGELGAIKNSKGQWYVNEYYQKRLLIDRQVEFSNAVDELDSELTPATE